MLDKKQDWVFIPRNRGERLPRIVLQDERFKSFDLNHLIGKPVVLFYVLNIHHPFCREMLVFIQKEIDAFREKGVAVVAISPNSSADLYDCAKKLNLLFPLLSDSEFFAAKALGIVLTAKAGPKEAVEVRRATTIVDSTLRVRKQYYPKEPKAHVLQVLNELDDTLPENKPYLIRSHAPVLFVPDVVEPGLCKEIASRKIVEPPFISYIDKRLFERVVPEVLKAFYFFPKKRKMPKIDIFTAESKGPTKLYRVHAQEQTYAYQYAIVIALNASDEYQGGGLCFPEYGLGYYKPRMGEAMIYSTFLLQEMLPVLSGESILLTSYFYDEDSDVFMNVKHQLNRGVELPSEKSDPNDPIF